MPFWRFPAASPVALAEFIIWLRPVWPLTWQNQADVFVADRQFCTVSLENGARGFLAANNDRFVVEAWIGGIEFGEFRHWLSFRTGTGFWMLDGGCWILDAGYWIGATLGSLVGEWMDFGWVFGFGF